VANPLHGVEHAENFPVASWLMPARLRPAVTAIYRFARHADDLADEGDAAPVDRLAALQRLREDLGRARAGGAPADPRVAALVPHVVAHRLDWAPFEALLSAFEQDVRVQRYADDAAVLDYCRRSAEPVGHLVLALADRLDATTRPMSDRVCTALQRINFLQDVAPDWTRGRLYLPLEALRRHGASEADLQAAIRDGRAPDRLRACIAEQAATERARMVSAACLPGLVGGRIGWELRAVMAGGLRILDQLARGGHDPFVERPRLRAADAPALLAAALRLAARGGAPSSAAAPRPGAQR
jgi:squalene synthase HpnC